MIPDKMFLTIDEVCNVLGLGRQSVMYLAEWKGLPAIHLFGYDRYFVPTKEFKKWIDRAIKEALKEKNDKDAERLARLKEMF